MIAVAEFESASQLTFYIFSTSANFGLGPSSVATLMSQNLLAKYYQENKDRLQKKKLVKNIKIFLKKKKKVTIWLRTLQKSLRR